MDLLTVFKSPNADFNTEVSPFTPSGTEVKTVDAPEDAPSQFMKSATTTEDLTITQDLAITEDCTVAEDLIIAEDFTVAEDLIIAEDFTVTEDPTNTEGFRIAENFIVTADPTVAEDPTVQAVESAPLPVAPPVPLSLLLQIAALSETYVQEVSLHTETLEALHRERAQALYAARRSALERQQRIFERELRIKEREQAVEAIQTLQAEVTHLETQIAQEREEKQQIHRHLVGMEVITVVSVVAGLASFII